MINSYNYYNILLIKDELVINSVDYLFVCLYVGSYFMNPITDLPQISIGELGRTTQMFLAWFRSSIRENFSVYVNVFRPWREMSMFIIIKYAWNKNKNFQTSLKVLIIQKQTSFTVLC